MKYPHLTRAPIREAVLNIAVAPVAWDDAKFASFDLLFPASNRHFEATLPIGGEASASTTKPVGKIWWNEARTRAAQARVNGFSVNHVGSYKDWAELLDEALRWWPNYVSAVNPATVQRCSLRFINQIELLPGEDLSTILKTRTEIGSGLPQEVYEYFSRVAVPFPNNIRASLTQVIEPRVDVAEESAPVVLVFDVDVSKTVSLACASPAIWETFEELRAVKNQCFFESLQESTLEKFK